MRVFEEAKITVSGNILPFGSFAPFLDIADASLSEHTRQSLIKNAEKILETPFELLKATDYLRFYRDGDRSVYEDIFFDRRKMVFTLLMGEYAEGKGRFADKLAEGVWHILEETTWCIPAHMKTLDEENYGLCDEYGAEVKNLDLFSASTGALLAAAYRYGKDALDGVTPVITGRVIYELNRRIFTPFLDNPELWWKGEHGLKVNNWNPWIISNVLTAAAFCAFELPLREKIVKNAICWLDNFTQGYAPDGGCDEGPSYWNVAGGSYFECLEILYDMSAGKIDVFGDPFVAKIMQYIMSSHISGSFFLPFADTHPRLTASYPLIARCGEKINSKALYAFGVCESKKIDISALNASCPYRSVKQLFCVFDEKVTYMPEKSVYFENLCVAALRESESENEGFYLTVKGGHNNESHNHNDAGNFAVYFNGEPLVIDVGVGTYCKDTFSSNRYKIWTMQSSFHNLPEINGIQQKAGECYRAKNAVFDREKQTFSLELSDAYPKEALLDSFVRTAALSDKTVTVCDEVSLKEKGKIAFNIMLADKPEEKSGAQLALAAGRTLRFSPSLDVKTEEIPLTDSGLKRDWERDSLYRVILTEENTRGGKYQLKLE